MTLIEEAIISGFIGETISRCTNISWTKIKEAVKNRKNKHQSIESQIYNVIVNVLNQITYNEFEDDQDKIYQAAEKLLMGYKDDRCDRIEVVRSGLQILGKNVNNDKYMQFKTLLYQELSKNDYEELYREIRLLQQDEESSKTVRIEQKVDKLQQSADETNRRLDAFKESNRVVDNVHNKKPIKSRTQEYADKWEANMFLNDFDKRDHNPGKNIKLSEVYLEEHLPHYIWYKNNEKDVSTDLKELLSEYINEKRDNKMLFILGQPGIGKSTLITWVAANFNNRADDIFVYKFAPDLGNVDWNDDRISNRILENLCLNYDDLKGKTLILDGFDEVSIEANRRRNILDNLYNDWIKNKIIENFSLVITCRENYVPQFAILKCKYITLQPWDERQIRSFCTIFHEKTENSISVNTIDKLIENKEILGIPLILYMVLALNISIEKEGSIVDVYDKIFSLEGGIYDRCIEYKSFADKHRISEIKMLVHQISREIAIWMFEYNPNGASISTKIYEKICKDIMKKQEKEDKEKEDKEKQDKEKQDYSIGSYFKFVCDGIETKELCFVHRSIYEYFAVEAIYSFIENFWEKLCDEEQEINIKKFSCYLKRGNIGNTTIRMFLKHKLIKLYKNLEIEKQLCFYEWWERNINKMMECGMFLNVNSNFQNYMYEVSICFLNLLEILRIVLEVDQLCKREYICQDIESYILEKYVKYCLIESEKGIFTGRTVNFEKMNLEEMDFRGVNFQDVNLEKVNLRNTNLMWANLYGANLNEVDLSYSCLVGAILSPRKLDKIIFSKDQIKDLEKYCDLEKANIYVRTKKDIVSYKKYCMYKKLYSKFPVKKFEL